VAGGTVNFGASDTALLGALDAAAGAKLFWLDARTPVFSSPSIASGVACFGTFGGRLHAVNLKTHEPLLLR
jgi:hypothetical protein